MIMHDLRMILVAVTEDYLADEDRCWSIAHTTDYHRSTAAGWEI
jgi:hypothetical protein